MEDALSKIVSSRKYCKCGSAQLIKVKCDIDLSTLEIKSLNLVSIDINNIKFIKDNSLDLEYCSHCNSIQ